MPRRYRRTLVDRLLAALVSRFRGPRAVTTPRRLSDIERDREIRYHEAEARRLRGLATKEARG